jgi:hypothetical protein
MNTNTSMNSTADTQSNTVTRDEGGHTDITTPIKTSAAQRQRAYRQRRRRAAIDAIGLEAQASRVTLLTMLGSALAALDTGTMSDHMTKATRSAVKRVLHAIVTRYAIEPWSSTSAGGTGQ